ncbi:MAG: flagellar hook-length control protein FliK, partial [Pseudomonadota bacterium]
EGDSPGFSGNSDQGQRQSAATLFQATKGSAPSGGNQPPTGDNISFEPASAPAVRPVFDPGATLPAIARGLEAVTMETGTAVRAGAAAQVFVPAARLTDTVGLRISRAVREGESRFTLRIDPPELGRIDVKLEFSSDNRLRATMVAENREALNILQRDAANLERALNDAGVKADSGSLNFSLKEQGDGHAAHAFDNFDDADDRLIADDEDVVLSAAAAEAIAQRATGHRLIDLSI